MTKYIFGLFLIVTQVSFSQEVVQTDSIVKPIIKISFLDSIKSTFVVDEMASCVDERVFSELTNDDIAKEFLADVKNIDIDKTVDYEFSTELFKERLRLLDEKSPFNIEYNVGLENIVKSFLKTRKRSFERLMGISQYYFPMFEAAMAKYNVPLEIKYLAIVESALNPKAVSRMGATGLWQFMYETGKQYKLNINSYVDDRKDVLKASDAAAQYMNNMYKIFGDWELVLASYNSGAGNVTKAIRRSGGHQNYWNIKKHLPRETAAYVPLFLATMYVFEYHKEHGIVPEKAIANHFATDTIAVKSKMSFKQISDLLDISEEQLEFFNPTYKTKVVPYVTNQLHYIRLPKDKISVFTSNENKVYAYLNYQENNREKAFVTLPKAKVVKDTIAVTQNLDDAIVEAKTVIKTVNKVKFHRVKRGENLTEIASDYNVSLSDLKNWNSIKGNNVQKGKNLKIITENNIVEKVKKPKTEAAIAEVKNEPLPKKATEIADKSSKNKDKLAKVEVKAATPVVIAEHVVKEGETLTSIAKENRLYVADLKKWNNLKDANIKLGDKLKLSNINNGLAVTDEKKQAQTIFYTVKKGDNISNIATLNSVSVENLKLWNNLNSNTVKVGEKLKIEKTEVIAEVIAEVAKKSKKDILQDVRFYTVQKGDSLYSISIKNNVTVAEIKKNNDIQNENIQPGMRLKI